MRLLVPPPVQGLVAGALIWGLDRYFPQFGVDFAGRKVIAGVFLASGVAIEIIAVATFVRARTTVNPLKPAKADKLVASGLYRFSRNPMYLGLLLVLIGWTIWLGAPLGVAVIAGFVAYITWSQIKPEENALREKFGDAYEDYRRSVRRWI